MLDTLAVDDPTILWGQLGLYVFYCCIYALTSNDNLQTFLRRTCIGKVDCISMLTLHVCMSPLRMSIYIYMLFRVGAMND